MSNRIPGQIELLGASLYEALARAGRRGLSRAEIGHAAESLGGREELSRMLARLERDGAVVEWNSRWYAVAATEWCAGELQGLAAGDMASESVRRMPAFSIGEIKSQSLSFSE